MTDRDTLVEGFMGPLKARHPHEPEFLRAVEDVARNVLTVEKAHSAYASARVLERLTEPDRQIGFRVDWQNDRGEIETNRGWRVQMSNAIGPYKGGLRFHPSVTPSILKFLAFEQCFKNALTGLPLGGAKGGADFDPRGRSEAEIMRFCQAFMRELSPHIGPDRDVPAGDINVGTREIGWLFGMYKALEGQFHGALTGKGMAAGGSALRIEATGYGLIYFVEGMLARMGDSIEGKRVAISGKGNVANHAAEKAIGQGALVVTLSDTSGTLCAPDGMTQEAVEWVRARKAEGGDIADPPRDLGLRYAEGVLPWGTMEAQIALPCATENEMDGTAAQAALDAGLMLLAEGANMPLTAEATDVLRDKRVLHAPGKASNAGGVAVSGLEMSQNRYGQFSSREEIDKRLKEVMTLIHGQICAEGNNDSTMDYRRAADVAGYRRLADAIASLGAV